MEDWDNPTMTDYEKWLYCMGAIRGIHVSCNLNKDFVADISSRIEEKLLPNNTVIDTRRILEKFSSFDPFPLINDTVQEIIHEQQEGYGKF